MPTALENALLIPTLFELAVRGERVELGRNGVNLIALLDSDSIQRVFHRATDRYEVFLAALHEVNTGHFGGFLCSAYEVLQPILAKHAGRKYGMNV